MMQLLIGKRKLFLLLMGLMLIALVACGGGDAEEEGGAEEVNDPAVVATEEVPVPEEPTAEPAAKPEDAAWDRIQASGRLLVGTSGDYPPFEFYNDNFQLEGFDIALMDALGEELDLVIEFQDMAFEGLGDALAVSQVDVAIAALSITPQREALADFTNVYYIGEDAILAAEGSNVGKIAAAEDLAEYTIGVQTNSVYEDWVRSDLIEAGLMTEESLHVYGTAEQAVSNLAAGRVDVVILDALPAEVATSYFDVEIIAQGLNRQRFAIAHLQDEPQLQQALNDALTALQNDGILADLAEKHLNLSDLPPIEPSEPVEPDPEEPGKCTDAAKFIGDLNLDDNNMTTPAVMQPGQAFRKGWRMQNVGTCTWDSSYKLAYASGNTAAAQMGGTFVPVRGTIAPGQTYDFWADLVAPTYPGVYQGFWEMRNGQNEAFGQRVWVGIQVAGPPTPVPVPTQTPSPTIQFTVDRTNIKQGDCVTFTWNVQNIQAVWFYPEGQDYNNYPTTGQNTSTQCPHQTTTYNLRVQYTDGSVEVRSITIYVEQDNSAPRITRFSVNPPSIPLGQCVQVQWTVEGNVSYVVIKRDGIAIWDNAPLSSTMSDCPVATGFAQYVIEANGPGGNARLQQNVSVLEQ